MAYFNSDDLFKAEHDVLKAVAAAYTATETHEPYDNARFLGFIEGVLTMAENLTKGDS